MKNKEIEKIVLIGKNRLLEMENNINHNLNFNLNDILNEIKKLHKDLDKIIKITKEGS